MSHRNYISGKAAIEARQYEQTYHVPASHVEPAARLFYAGKQPVAIAQAFRRTAHLGEICDYLLRMHRGVGRDPKQIAAIKRFYAMTEREQQALCARVLAYEKARRNPARIENSGAMNF
ncbi:hypothetical protein HY492_01365 [Candidatus Woesearchaeota archaeon]|nr:hypothetical protein [Candidatus Woesearchaeota archaeon]